jgi:hypothetical protein
LPARRVGRTAMVVLGCHGRGVDETLTRQALSGISQASFRGVQPPPEVDPGGSRWQIGAEGAKAKKSSHIPCNLPATDLWVEVSNVRYPRTTWRHMSELRDARVSARAHSKKEAWNHCTKEPIVLPFVVRRKRFALQSSRNLRRSAIVRW